MFPELRQACSLHKSKSNTGTHMVHYAVAIFDKDVGEYIKKKMIKVL